MLLTLALAAAAADVTVTDVATLRSAVAAAAPGDTLTLAPGTYRLDSTLTASAAGRADAPITLRGEPGARIESDTVEAIKVTAPYWVFDGLSMQGVCADHSQCEHALHIVGEADGTVVRGCTLQDFNAQIKGNGEEIAGVYVYPDDVVIEGSTFFDSAPRETGNPVTKIDVVGGRRWRVEANFIHDFEKGGGDTVSYAAFLKGNSRDGVFERNLVACSLDFDGGVRLGLSFGGGGTSPDSICEDGTCTPEHQGGVMRNNVIVGCSDVGVYLNEAADCVVSSNTLYATEGIDVRFEASTVTLAGNLLDADIKERDDGVATLGTNLTDVDLSSWFVDPLGLDFTLLVDPGPIGGADVDPLVADDFCGQPRDAAPDLGAVEYTSPAPCDTTRPHPDAEADTDTDTDTDSDTDTDADADTDTDTDTDADTDTDTDADTDADTDPPTDTGGAPKGCGCASSGPGGALTAAAGLVALRRRARRG